MPIKGDYTWAERSDSLLVSVPLKGVSAKLVDIVVSASTIKVNFSPYLVEVLLHKRIDAVKHKAKVKEGVLNMTLYKETPGIWGRLEVDSEGLDKAALQDMRKAAAQSRDQLEVDMQAKRKDKRIEDERFSLRKQMGMDEDERNRIEGLKADEKKEAEKDVYETFQRMQGESKAASTASSTRVAVSAAQQAVAIASKAAAAAPAAINEKSIFDIEDMMMGGDIDSEEEKEEEEEEGGKGKAKEDSNEAIEEADVNAREEAEVKYLAPPRSAGVSSDSSSRVSIEFTPRIFPTPLRESKMAEEEDWVAKNRRHLKKNAKLHLPKAKRGDVSEEDPHWLKAKGDDFVRKGDCRSAINAYSSALDVDDTLTICFANRSVCYLKLNYFAECRLDCTAGIKLLEEDSSSNDISKIDPANTDRIVSVVADKNMLIKLLMRRGSASCQLGLFQESVDDYLRCKDVLRSIKLLSCLLPKDYVGSSGSKVSIVVTDDTLDNDIANLLTLLQADCLKKEADSAFADKNIELALSKYSEALQLVPVHVGCLSNRAACKIAINDVEGCIADCTSALDLMTVDPTALPSSSSSAGAGLISLNPTSSGSTGGGVAMSMLLSIVPPPGSDKRKQWIIKTITRRGVAYMQARLYREAVDDYSTASALDPSNEQLKSDLNKVRTLKEGQAGGQQRSQ